MRDLTCIMYHLSIREGMLCSTQRGRLNSPGTARTDSVKRRKKLQVLNFNPVEKIFLQLTNSNTEWKCMYRVNHTIPRLIKKAVK